MQHLSEEQLVAFHYRDLDAPAQAGEHLQSCAECTSQYETICGVLALVSDVPVPERGASYGEEVWTRLRWKLGSRERRRRWQSLVALAAMLAIAFVAGQFFRVRRDDAPTVVAAKPAAMPVLRNEDSGNRLLLAVVGEHLDTSGRVLLEVANASSGTELDSQPRRAEDLVSANRIYRQTAAQQGDERIVQLLTDLEPILLELANAEGKLEGNKLTELQKRIESKELLFKVRVMSAPGGGADLPRPIQTTTHSL